jgi:hypothetical protein
MNREVLQRSLEELRAQLERHERLLQAEDPGGDRPDDPCAPGRCPHQTRLCQVLLEMAVVLDGTRKAFKSPQLEALRKRCLRIVAEEVGSESLIPNPRPGAARAPAGMPALGGSTGAS